MFANMDVYGLDADDREQYLNAARGYLHYMHGVNPLNAAYLSSMAAFGAENSVPEFYHGWFRDGSAWDSAETSIHGLAPDFVPGGPPPPPSTRPVLVGPPIVPPQSPTRAF